MPTRPMDRTSWAGPVSRDPDGIVERLLDQYPVGSRIAVSSVVGTWSHDLTIETIVKIEKVADDHIVIVTDDYVRGLTADEQVCFGDDYRGLRFQVRKENGFGEPITWKFLRVEPERTDG